ncbi:metallophosphoesterase [Yoonia sp. F2084L]|uniref:metallophosphoesterase n=1 Tax=Yoonia sp. F2084L TaxID=2926419 RepID=UPI001FF2D6CD|nr:metallophosphoesterase [Yoonia sp. F2084L]MCK0096080.1 metallophosphoesterase [Yoonia sp. F2084L]
MKPIYAIGDVHGQKDMLDHALALITADGGVDAKIVFVGDYTDRGPDSRAVIDTLIAGRDAGRDWVFIKGNHDRFFTHFVRYGRQHDARVASGINWFNPRLGGTETLASYGIKGVMRFAQDRIDGREMLEAFEAPDGTFDAEALQQMALTAVPTAHLDFLDTLPLWFETDDLLFVHAGLRPGLPIDQQDPEDLLWIRDPFLTSDEDFGKLVVHGHTALDYPQHFGNRVDLDGGAGYHRPLIPAVFEGRDCWLLTDQGRVSLTP